MAHPAKSLGHGGLARCDGIYDLDAMDMNAIVSTQRAFFETGATRPVAFRLQQLKAFQQALREHEERLCAAIREDFGKSTFDTVTTELAILHHDLKESIAKVAKWSARKRVPTPLANFPARSFVIPEPLGVALVMGAWNYPYQLSFAPAIAALTAGCTVVLKPSELPARTSQAIASLVRGTFAPEVFTVVEGGVAETTALLAERFDKIFFTGSVPVGRVVYQAAARHLTPVTLELGGKSPALVAADCNLAMTARRLVWAKYLNAGQTCIAPDYVLVEDSIREAFLEAVKGEIVRQKFRLENDNYVQIVNERNFRRVRALIPPEKVFFGGGCDEARRLIEPTVLAGVGWEDAVMQEEIFGPVLPVIPFTDLDSAIAQVKARPRPLSCYVFTTNAEIRERVLNEISFGGGCVNDAILHVSNPHLPFGGVGESGIGAYHGEEGFRAFTHFKAILDKPTWFEPFLKYAPHTPQRLKWIRRLME
jgi:aldehyde dehydrogenase (NAD+)